MSDFQRNVGGQDVDEDRLPWLEPVDDYEDDEGISIGRLIAAVIVGLVALGLVIGGIFWLRNSDEGGGGTLITAPEGPIKEKPGTPGGMEVDGAGDVAYDASVGKDVNSTIDLTALPETPVTQSGAVKPAEIPASTSKPAPPPAAVTAKTQIAAAIPPKVAVPPKAVTLPKPSAEKPVPAPKPLLPASPPSTVSSSTGGSIQLGAFSSNEMANKAWTSLSGRFGFLAGLGHSVNSVTVGDKTLYRLRANAGAQAGATCAKLKVAGEACSVVD